MRSFGNDMPTGLLIGPYARQVTGLRLKFWFAFVLDDGAGIDRYEMGLWKHDKELKARRRPVNKPGAPFSDYRIPSDLSAYPSESFPRFPREKLADAALTLLLPLDIAAVTQVRFGITPTIATHGTQGDDQCTLRQPLLI
jgi:hypothetical protein